MNKHVVVQMWSKQRGLQKSDLVNEQVVVQVRHPEKVLHKSTVIVFMNMCWYRCGLHRKFWSLFITYIYILQIWMSRIRSRLVFIEGEEFPEFVRKLFGMVSALPPVGWPVWCGQPFSPSFTLYPQTGHSLSDLALTEDIWHTCALIKIFVVLWLYSEGS